MHCSLSIQAQIPFNVLQQPLRILLFTAASIVTNYSPLQLNTEQCTVRQAVKPALLDGKVQLRVPYDGSFAAWQALLQEQAWDVVIMSGHGRATPAAFAFEDPTGGGVHWVDAGTIATHFAQAKVSCVVFNACDSATRRASSTSLATVLAQQACVPHVIGMRGQLFDRAGTHFVSAFCQALINGQSIAYAVQQGRNAMTQLLNANECWQGAPDLQRNSAQWHLPVLYSARPATQLLPAWCVAKKSLVCTRSVLPELLPLYGRRAVLRTLSALLQQADTQTLHLYGARGIGKTAVAHQLVWGLYEAGYSVECIGTEHWRFSDATQSVRYFQVAQQVLPHTIGLVQYALPTLKLTPLQHYLLHLGFDFNELEMRLLHHAISGNLYAVHLLQTLPKANSHYDFKRQLVILKRFVRAH